VGTTLASLPRYLVLDPVATVRIEVELERYACEIDVEIQNPRTGRSFVLLLGPRGGPYVRRMRLSGRARILFQPKTAGPYVLMLANPQKEPIVLRLKGRQIGKGGPPRRAGATAGPAGAPRRRRSRHGSGRRRPLGSLPRPHAPRTEVAAGSFGSPRSI
jgi:hypothetical protein